jgi:chromosome segregation ATPase
MVREDQKPAATGLPIGARGGAMSTTTFAVRQVAASLAAEIATRKQEKDDAKKLAARSARRAATKAAEKEAKDAEKAEIRARRAELHANVAASAVASQFYNEHVAPRLEGVEGRVGELEGDVGVLKENIIGLSSSMNMLLRKDEEAASKVNRSTCTPKRTPKHTPVRKREQREC